MTRGICSVRLCFGQAWLGPVGRGTAMLGVAWLGLARHGWARLG
jgi:hypothetical protein